ncbi:MAG: phosphate acyltransferase PlsX [Acidimicrobiales bacterium]
MAASKERPSAEELTKLPVALDAMGGDKAPREVVIGAREAADAGVPVVLVGPPDEVGDTLGVELVACTEFVTMDEDPTRAVRSKKDSSLVRAAEMVRDGRASAMVSAGNTGATMASALLRMGRLPGVSRPCIVTPMPRRGRPPAVLVDAGANVECTPAMLAQFAQMASVLSTVRFGVENPSAAVLSIGEEPSKGTQLVKETHGLLDKGVPGVRFVGNVEGRDLLDCPADVVVTDGFTGNVALKTAEGAMRFAVRMVADVLDHDDATRKAGEVLMPYFLEAAAEVEPENTGGAMLLGVEGVCVISHGSSSRVAIGNAVSMAHGLASSAVVSRLAELIAQTRGAQE